MALVPVALVELALVDFVVVAVFSAESVWGEHLQALALAHLDFLAPAAAAAADSDSDWYFCGFVLVPVLEVSVVILNLDFGLKIPVVPAVDEASDLMTDYPVVQMVPADLGAHLDFDSVPVWWVPVAYHDFDLGCHFPVYRMS